MMNFIRPIQDWEEESISFFLDLLYSSSVKGYGLDKLCWRGSQEKGFQVKSLYRSLLPQSTADGMWKKIWKPKAPPGWHFLYGLLLWIVFLPQTTLEGVR